MAKSHNYYFLIITLVISLLPLAFSTTSLEEEQQHGNNGDSSFIQAMNILNRKEKLSHFKFYWHDTYSGKNPSAVQIVKPPANQASGLFGTMSMIDDPLTERPDLGSKLLGRAQGLYGLASQKEVALIMAMNFHFVQGKYNGSGITILGRNPVFDKVRELPVIGGSGLFRFARGYARASTHTFDAATGDAVVEYNVYVLHYG